MAKCWRCGGGKTISVTTTGMHALPCPTCGGASFSFSAGRDWKSERTQDNEPFLESRRTSGLQKMG